MSERTEWNGRRRALERATAWGRLLRLPNLLTVPGDPLAGFLLAGGAATIPDLRGAALPALAALLLYAFGLITNDLFDLREDRRERPGRPLPSRQVSWLSAIAAAAIFALGGNTAAWGAGVEPGLVAAGVTLAVVAYNAGLKRVVVAGPVAMGLCRAGSLLIGAAAAGWWGQMGAVPVTAAFLAAYIAAVTHIAAGETRHRVIGRVRLLPGGVLIAWVLVLMPLLTHRVAALDGAAFVAAVAIAAGLVLGCVLWVMQAGDRLSGRPQPATVQRAIGQWIQGLLLVQAMLCALTGWPGTAVAVVLAALFPAARAASRRFYSS